MPTHAETLDDGLKFYGDDGEKLTFRNALFGALIGSDQADGGVGFGTYHVRTSVTETGISVSGNEGEASKPGPVISVQVTAGSAPGPYPLQTVPPVVAGYALVEPQESGRDLVQFHGDDAVTEMAVRYLPMPEDMHDALNTDPEES